MKANVLKINDYLIRLATPAGLEPATCRLEGGCSIQLSYGAGRALARVFVGILLTYKTLAYGICLQVKYNRKDGSMGPLVETGRFKIIGIALDFPGRWL